MNTTADFIIHHGRIATLDPKLPRASSLAVKDAA